MGEYEAILRHEFSAEAGSFLLQLRCDLFWDKIAFARLVKAMEQCARDHQNRELVERWVAHGFWYLETFTPDWSSHANFPRPESEEYYKAAYERLFDLAYWLFEGSSAYQSANPLPEIG